MPDGPTPVPVGVCVDCGTEVAPTLLACPMCGRLAHAETLKALSAEADRSAAGGDPSSALAAWRQALDLLPPDSRQHAAVRQKIEELGRQVERAPVPRPQRGGAAKGIAGLGALGLLLWKLKAVVLFAVTKGKALLLGLTKASTFFSMALSFSVYWAAWGWKFALGLVLSIYVHEMGHVSTLRRYGIAATAPMFIPGFGALIRLKQSPSTPREDARTGLAGPLWGFGAAAAALAVFLWTGAPIWGAIARCGAWINLFNLIPVWQLDGGRGIRSLSRAQRWVLAAVCGGMWFMSGEGLLLLLLLAVLFRAMGSDAPKESDPHGLLEFAFLAVALSMMCMLPVPMEEPR
mgnify:CR=1 FL=1